MDVISWFFNVPCFCLTNKIISPVKSMVSQADYGKLHRYGSELQRKLFYNFKNLRFHEFFP